MGSGWSWPAMAGAILAVCALIALAEYWELIVARVKRWRRRD